MPILKPTPLLAALKWALLPGTAALLMTACMSDRDQDASSSGTGLQPATEVPGPAFDEKKLIAQGLAQEAPQRPIRLPDDEEPSLSTPPHLAMAAAGTPVYINFQDPDALALIPDVNSTFVTWPGYIQDYDYKSWLYVWMSHGPKKEFFGYDEPNHFHILWDNSCSFSPGVPGVLVNGVCTSNLPSTLNRYQGSMYGSDWLAAYAQTSGEGRVKFNLYKIKVKGKTPISLWYKSSGGGWYYWDSLEPGTTWSLPSSRNIWEFHIAATTRGTNDKYFVDNIQVSTP